MVSLDVSPGLFRFCLGTDAKRRFSFLVVRRIEELVKGEAIA